MIGNVMKEDLPYFCNSACAQCQHCEVQRPPQSWHSAHPRIWNSKLKCVFLNCRLSVRTVVSQDQPISPLHFSSIFIAIRAKLFGLTGGAQLLVLWDWEKCKQSDNRKQPCATNMRSLCTWYEFHFLHTPNGEVVEHSVEGSSCGLASIFSKAWSQHMALSIDSKWFDIRMS